MQSLPFGVGAFDPVMPLAVPVGVLAGVGAPTPEP